MPRHRCRQDEPERPGLRDAEAPSRARQLGPGEKVSLHELAGDARRLAQPRPPRAHAARLGGAPDRQVAARLLRDAADRVGDRRGLRRPARTRAPGGRERHRPRRPGRAAAASASCTRRPRRRSRTPSWDTANAAFHEYQVDLAGNALLSRFYRELSVNLMMQVIRGGKLEGGAYLADRARRDRRRVRGGRPRARPHGDPGAHRHAAAGSRSRRSRRPAACSSRAVVRRPGCLTIGPGSANDGSGALRDRQP